MKLAGQAHFVDQTQEGLVVQADEVIVALQVLLIDLERAGQAAKLGFFLEEGHLVSCLCEPVGRRQPGDATANDRDAHQTPPSLARIIG